MAPPVEIARAANVRRGCRGPAAGLADGVGEAHGVLIVTDSPFAVGYADTKPVLSDFTMTVMVFTVDEAIKPVTLPSVRTGSGDGDPIYALSPEALPPGLTRNPDTHVISGTPTEEFAKQPYT